MNYKEYCNKNKIPFDSPASAKMYYFYKEAEAASTDCKMKPMNINQTYAAAVEMQLSNNYLSFAPITPQVCCTTAPVPCAKTVAICNLKKGNNPMYIENDKHIESSKTNYLVNRASMSYSKKRNEMFEVFHLDTPEVPRTPELLVEAITSGAYQIKPKNERNTYDRATNQIIWRSADIKADQAGYDKATDELSAFYRDVQDTIVVGTPVEALAKVKALDAWTPTMGNA